MTTMIYDDVRQDAYDGRWTVDTLYQRADGVILYDQHDRDIHFEGYTSRPIRINELMDLIECKAPEVVLDAYLAYIRK